METHVYILHRPPLLGIPSNFSSAKSPSPSSSPPTSPPLITAEFTESRRRPPRPPPPTSLSSSPSHSPAVDAVLLAIDAGRLAVELATVDAGLLAVHLTVGLNPSSSSFPHLLRGVLRTNEGKARPSETSPIAVGK
ncbi:hypothetical protein NL676_039884 [Syzygium grande]|nr:hypothetical protein NL676_039884 [Syzygium grande]